MNPGSSLRIGRILGIPIYIHASWVFIFVLITMSLGAQFTQQHPQWTPTQHWSVGVLTSLLFFASILFHELSHSMVARAYKIRVDSITLFVFGGVARIAQRCLTSNPGIQHRHRWPDRQSISRRRLLWTYHYSSRTAP